MLHIRNIIHQAFVRKNRRPFLHCWILPIVHLGLFVFCLSGVSPTFGETSLSVQDIIANVEANELLYNNIEIVYVMGTKQVNENRILPPDRAYAVRTIRYRSVLQKSLLRVEFQDQGVVASGKQAPRANLVAGYDGEITRINQNNSIYNIVHNRKEVEGLLRPHNLTFGTSMYAPLSVWLRGGETLRKHPGAQVGWGQADIRPKYVGEEVIRGIRCHKLLCECFFPDGKGGFNLVETITLWLSPTYNYLPVQAECVKTNKPQCPLALVACEDFREIQEGIWFPFKTTITKFDNWASTAENRIVDHVETYTMSLVKLDPGYPVSFFQDVPIPDGAMVYEITNGVISKGYRHEDSSVTPAPDPDPQRRRWIWLVLGVTFVLAIICIYFVRRRGHPLPSEDGEARQTSVGSMPPTT